MRRNKKKLLFFPLSDTSNGSPPHVSAALMHCPVIGTRNNNNNNMCTTYFIIIIIMRTYYYYLSGIYYTHRHGLISGR